MAHFTPKQSDIFYNDETKEMFVCKVSGISAERCDDGSETVYGAVPLVYKIDKNTNYKSRVYPSDISEFSTSSNSDLFNLTPTCPEGTNFESITKPLINYNKTTQRYSVTFLGRYSDDNDGLGVNNYVFKHIDNKFHLLDANIYIPKSKFTSEQFTFENGHINSDLYVVGNTVRNDKPSWFNPAGVEVERSTDYQIAPMYVQSTSALGFNLILTQQDTTVDPITGNVTYPFMYSGGFITYNPKYTAFDPEYTIRVDFRARCFNNVSSPTDPVTAYASTQSVGQSATRWVQQYAPDGAGEGFCVSFFKNPPVSSYVIPNGIGSTLGYAEADFSSNEVAGTAQATDGLYLHNNWNPNTGPGVRQGGHPGMGIKGSIGDGTYGPAESFLGVGFDIGGNFATTSEDKKRAYADNETFTAKPCSIGIRGSSFHETKALTSFAMNTVAASSVPMHTSAANADFVDYRIDLTNKGTKVTLYNKLTSATDYNTIAELRLNKIGGGNIGEYTPWEGLRSAEQIENKEWPLLNVGLSFTTSTNVSRFELHKFEVTGVVVNNPWEKKEEQKTVTKKIDYLHESSKNLRKQLINVESDEPVDIELSIPAKNIIANTINEETNRPQITLCDGSDSEVIEEDVDIRITDLHPDRIDKTIEIAERGEIPKNVGGPTTIKHVGRNLDVDTFIEATGVTEKVSWDSWLECRIPHLAKASYEVLDVRIGEESGGTEISVSATGRYAWLHMTDRKYSIWVQVLILDEFLPYTKNNGTLGSGDDLNDWFNIHPFGGQVRKKRDSEYAIKANNILKSIIRAFINSDKTNAPTCLNWALKWHAQPNRPSDLKKNELMERINPDTNEPYIGLIEDNWIKNFENIGFEPLDPTDFENNTLVPYKDGVATTSFGSEWACAKTWDIPSGGGREPLATGSDTGERKELPQIIP